MLHTHHTQMRGDNMEVLKIVQPSDITTTKLNLGNFLPQYFNNLDIGEKSKATYKRALKQFFRFIYGRGSEEPRKQDILDFKREKENSCKPTTAQNYLVVVKSFFSWLENEGLYPNITKGVKGISISKEHKKDYLTTNQVKILLDFDRERVKDLRDYAIIILMITGGLRTVEVARANIEDFRALGDKTALYLQGKGRTDKSEFLIIPEQVEKIILEYLKTRKEAKPSDPLFTSTSNNNKGKRLTTRTISGIVKERMEEVGFKSDKLTAHSLRHTAITLSLLQGNTIQEVQAFARHRNISTTQIYAHNIELAKNQCSNSIASTIFG